MNTHDKYKLPPLPTIGGLEEAIKRGPEDVGRLMRSYARAAIEADRKRRGEPVAWLYEDELPDNYPYEAMFPYSKVDGVRMFPVYTPQPAEPVKVPSDAEDDIVEMLSEYADHNTEHGRMSFDKWTLREAVSALLARYGQQAQPIDPANDNPTPEEEEAWQQMEKTNE